MSDPLPPRHQGAFNPPPDVSQASGGELFPETGRQVRDHWGAHPSPQPPPPAHQLPPPVVVVSNGPRYVSGLSTGGHLMHGALTVCSCGMWSPIWVLHWWLSRRRIR